METSKRYKRIGVQLAETEEIKSRPTILVGWVTSGIIRAEFVRSLLALQIYPLENWILGGTMDQVSAYIDDNRNGLVWEFLENTKADWLLMVDIDMAFNPLAVDKMYEFVKAGEQIVAGIYNTVIAMPDGTPKLMPLSYRLNKDTDRYIPVSLVEPTYVDGAPAGFLLLGREGLEQLKMIHGPMWFTRIPTEETGRYYGEDLSFCRRAIKAGLKVLAVPKLEIRHLKIVPI